MTSYTDRGYTHAMRYFHVLAWPPSQSLASKQFLSAGTSWLALCANTSIQGEARGRFGTKRALSGEATDYEVLLIPKIPKLNIKGSTHATPFSHASCREDSPCWQGGSVLYSSHPHFRNLSATRVRRHWNQRCATNLRVLTICAHEWPLFRFERASSGQRQQGLPSIWRTSFECSSLMLSHCRPECRLALERAKPARGRRGAPPVLAGTRKYRESSLPQLEE